MKKNWIDVHNNLHFHQKTLTTKDKLTNLLFKVGHLKSPSGSYTKKKWEDNAKKSKILFPS